MLLEVGYIDKTTKLASSDTPVSFEVDWPTTTYVVYVDHAVHVKRSPQDNPVDATTEDFPIPAGAMILMKLYEGEQFSFVLATGETDGNIWVSSVSIG